MSTGVKVGLFTRRIVSIEDTEGYLFYGTSLDVGGCSVMSRARDVSWGGAR